MKKKVLIIALIILVIIGIILGINFINKEDTEQETQVEEDIKEDDFSKLISFLEKSDGIQVYMDSNATDEEIEEVGNQILALGTDGNLTITLVSKEEALEEMREQLGSDADLLDAYEGDNNIFPAYYTVTLKFKGYFDDIDEITDYIDSLEEQILSLDKVSKVISSFDTTIEIYDEYGIEYLEEYEKYVDGEITLQEFRENVEYIEDEEEEEEIE